MSFTSSAAVSSSLPKGFTEREFRQTLGTFATGVTIVTTHDVHGHPVGLTVSSFNSVSLSPPLVLWSLAYRSHSIQVFERCSHYVIHVLTAQQLALAQSFASKGIDRFSGLALERSPNGFPVLPDCLAWFECRNRSQHPEGDHLVLVGEVEHCHRAPLAAAPLLYHGGQLHDSFQLV
jgi:flavin reductase (DIM6/NTAB) family NADH-FMN oxidoreductase RutF